MTALADIILPVFLIVGFGYVSTLFRWMSDSAIDGLMRFAQNFAVPVLLFGSMSRLDLQANFQIPILLAFYVGAFASFAVGWLAAQMIFNRSAPEAVAIGFVCLFSNGVLLGIPITERAFGTEALAGNWTIIAIHSPTIYTFGITMMEFARARGSGASIGRTALRALTGVFRTPMVIGILSGLVINVLTRAGLVMPVSFWDAVALISTAAIPAALFGLGGVLYRYRPEGDMSVIAVCCACSLLVHPAITYGLGRALSLDHAALRSAVLMAAMPPGVNAYLFANVYGVSKRAAASAVLIATGLAILTIWMWLAILP